MIEGGQALVASASLELLHKIFTDLGDGGLDTASVPVLVAIDTESSRRGVISELGVSVLDPLTLVNMRSRDLDTLNSCITTYHYAKDGSRKRHNFKPYRLGTPQPRLRNEDIPQILDTHLRPMDADGQSRQVILIGHYFHYDLHLLEACSDIDLSLISNVKAILDTHLITRCVLQDPNRTSLKKVLKDLNLDFIGLHNAGHDSQYTMRVLLMLFTIYLRLSDNVYQNRNDDLDDMVLLLEGIAQCHKPNERIKWTTPVRVKNPPVSDIFSQADGDLDDGGIMALFE